MNSSKHAHAPDCARPEKNWLIILAVRSGPQFITTHLVRVRVRVKVRVRVRLRVRVRVRVRIRVKDEGEGEGEGEG